MITAKKLVDLICGGEEECIRDLEDLRSLVKFLDDLATRLEPFKLSDKLEERPLRHGLLNYQELVSKVEEEVGDKSLADYVVRRRLYLEASRRGIVKDTAGGKLCPVCGEPPRIIVLRKSGLSDIFSGFVPHAMCSCGMDWVYDEWTCPRCGAAGREVFAVYLSKAQGLEVRKCKQCGNHVLIVHGGFYGERQYIYALLSLLLERIIGAGVLEEADDGQ